MDNAKYPTQEELKGASFDKRLSKWVASLTINRKKVYLGVFPTQEEAYEAVLNYKEE